MNTKSKILLVASISLIGLISTCILLLYYAYSMPYKEFLIAEKEALPKFSELNRAIYTQLPAPNDVTERDIREPRSPGLVHGAILYVEYEYSHQTPEDILRFYDSYFRDVGWERFVISDYSLPNIVYYTGSACVEVFFLSSPTYELQIYNDYFAQEFAPKIPQAAYWHEIDNGGPQFVRCPPFIDPNF